MTPEKVIEVQKHAREPISLHTPFGEDGDSELGDLIEDSEAIQPGEAVSFTLLQEQMHSVLGTLSEREAGIVSMRFGLTDGQPKTLDEIGKVYGVTRERIRQIESKTMSKLRHPSCIREPAGSRAGNESGAGSALPRSRGCLVLVSVAGSRRTTLRASLQDLEKQRREPARTLMARDVCVR